MTVKPWRSSSVEMALDIHGEPFARNELEEKLRYGQAEVRIVAVLMVFGFFLYHPVNAYIPEKCIASWS